ncbi:hypothetical protein MNBD_GAMMA21-140 [hydrothermal vent metagenome]|uniref:Uncharacterized protein n=1 Tax=hydrothermal vent metagenome TaxID=652676 RepID=A0A3B0ZQ62_9ZZZZ
MLIYKYNVMFLLLFITSLSAYAIDVLPELSSHDEADKAIVSLTQKITASPEQAKGYIKRGGLYFLIHDFDRAVEDFSKAISLDKNHDDAYYWRGMALGRQGFVRDGIADLTVYITRNPDSSLAYTKRGVRYIWLGDNENAFKDLSKAIELDPNNAEAHDDFGVVLAQQGNYSEAVKHFHATVSIDPTYQKGHHNLAMAYFVIEKDAQALSSVDESLRLAPDFRNSLILKSKILNALGRVSEAKELEEEAQFLPQSGDWTEHVPVQ